MPDPNPNGNGSPSDTPGGQGSTVPLERLNEVIADRNNLRERLATLEGRLTELSSRQTQQPAALEPKPQPKEYTRAQLAQAVASGQITQERADQIYDEQTERRILRRVDERVAETAQTMTHAQRVDAELGKYKSFKPDAFIDNGNADRAKARSEFDYLVSIGHPSSVETELAALRAAFGAPQAPVEKPRQFENHEEIMSGSGTRGGDQGTDEANAERPPKGLTADEKKYYGGLIEKGVYKDWNQVRGEMKHAKPGLRQRVAARGNA